MSDQPRLTTLVEKLTELDREEFDDRRDEAILELVEAIADCPGGSRELVDRVPTVRNPAIPRSVTFVLAQRANAVPDAELCGLALDLVGQLRDNRDPTTSINLMTAIHRLVIEGCQSEQIARQGEALAGFLLDSLNNSAAVQTIALGLLNRLDEDRLLPRVFAADTRVRLQRRLADLAVAPDSRVREEAGELAAFLARHEGDSPPSAASL